MENPGSDNKTNIGLSMKFEAKGQKVLGYSQKTESGWEYSCDAVKLIEEYLVSLDPIPRRKKEREKTRAPGCVFMWF